MFGTTGTAQALGPAQLSPVAVGAARMVVGGALLTAWASWMLRGTDRAVWPARGLVVAALSIAAYQPLFFVGVQRVGVALGTVIAIGSGPFIAGALSWLLGAGRPGPRWLMATTVGVAGVAVLLLSDARVAGEPLGVVCALGAGFAYAAYTVAVKAALDRGAAPTAAVGAVFGLAGLVSLPLLLVAGAGWLLTPQGLAIAGFLGLVPTALAYILYLRGLQHLSAPTVTTIVLAEPVTAALLGVALLAERLSAGGLVGAGLVFLGLLLVARDGASRSDGAANVARGTAHDRVSTS